MSTSTKPTQLQQLTAYIHQSLGGMVKSNDIDAWQESGLLKLSGGDFGTGFQLAKWHYKATIEIQKFPHEKIDPYNLFALVAAFLIEHGDERDTYGLSDPDIDIDLDSKDTSMVMINVDLMDDIEIVPDANGLIMFSGKRYKLDTPPLHVAESVELQESRAQE